MGLCLLPRGLLRYSCVCPFRCNLCLRALLFKKTYFAYRKEFMLTQVYSLGTRVPVILPRPCPFETEPKRFSELAMRSGNPAKAVVGLEEKQSLLSGEDRAGRNGRVLV